MPCGVLAARWSPHRRPQASILDRGRSPDHHGPNIMYIANATTPITVRPNMTMSVRSYSMDAPVLTQRESWIRFSGCPVLIKPSRKHLSGTLFQPLGVNHSAVEETVCAQDHGNELHGFLLKEIKLMGDRSFLIDWTPSDPSARHQVALSHCLGDAMPNNRNETSNALRRHHARSCDEERKSLSFALGCFRACLT